MFVTIQNHKISVPDGTTLHDLAIQYQINYNYPVIVARVNGVIQELYHTVLPDTEIEFCTLACNDGKRAYVRGISMLLLKVIKEELSEVKAGDVTIDFSLDTGYYCEIKGKDSIPEELTQKIQKSMEDYVKKDIPFVKKVIRTRDSKELFERLDMPDKALLMQFRRNSRMTVYELDGYVDYYYGAMPYSTGLLSYFELRPFDKGFVFIIPEQSAPTTVPKFHPSVKLYKTMQLANEWNSKMEVSTVGELNHAVVKGRLQELLLTQEALHEKRIGDIAEMIVKRGSRVVTIAGPSSSGKTTFSYRLSTQLRTLGFRPHPIGLDDYFVNREETPKDVDGNYDYECIGAIDVDLFNRNLNALLAGKEVQLPTYNFITGKREYDKPVLQMEPDEILVIEGIHGLNDKLTYSIAEKDKFKIYISALTTLNLDGHSRIPTTECRLLRRILRDSRTRGNSAQKTISMWSSVRHGEQKNIFPFQEHADAMFNSALIYELAAMKLYVDPLLFQVPKDCPEYTEAQRLLKFLDYFIPIDPHDVPLNSILREFIGGGILLG